MKIAIIGFGVEGKALLKYFFGRGHEITVCDIQSKDGMPKSKRIHTRFGPHYLENLGRFDLIFRSPGIPYFRREFEPVRRKLSSATKYFFEKCPCTIAGITGTKGKGTTATLLYEMVKSSLAGRGGKKHGRVFLGGNIDEPPLIFLDSLKKKDLVILELSSFQLQDIAKSPRLAVVLGITEDHFDHHATMEEYVAAKQNIVRFQKASDVAVLDFDNALSREFAEYTKASVRFVSTEKPLSGKPGASPKNRKNAFVEGGFIKVGSLVLNIGGKGMIVGEKGATGLIGSHNLKNILAAAVAAESLGVPVETIAKVIREFKGLPHRLEFVAERKAVKYYNDSASTNPQTAIAAVRTSPDRPLILILGGSDKNADFTPLGEEIAKQLNVKTVVLMGETKQKIERAVEDAVAREEKRIRTRGSAGGLRRRDIPLELITASSYQEAFMVARLIAQPGDTVLLSPACASFDMFENYRERGDVFRNFVLSE